MLKAGVLFSLGTICTALGIEHIQTVGNGINDRQDILLRCLLAAGQAALCIKLLTGKPVETGVLHYADLLYEEYTQIPMK